MTGLPTPPKPEAAAWDSEPIAMRPGDYAAPGRPCTGSVPLTLAWDSLCAVTVHLSIELRESRQHEWPHAVGPAPGPLASAESSFSLRLPLLACQWYEEGPPTGREAAQAQAGCQWHHRATSQP